MDKILWAASFEYDRPHLAKVTIAKETEQSYTISGGKDVIGFSYFGRRFTLKSSYQWFESAELAIKYLSRRYDEYIQNLENRVTKARGEQKTLVELLAKLESLDIQKEVTD